MLKIDWDKVCQEAFGEEGYLYPLDIEYSEEQIIKLCNAINKLYGQTS